MPQSPSLIHLDWFTPSSTCVHNEKWSLEDFSKRRLGPEKARRVVLCGLIDCWQTAARGVQQAWAEAQQQARRRQTLEGAPPVCSRPNVLIGGFWSMPYGVSHNDVGLEPLGVVEERRHGDASSPAPVVRSYVR